MVSRQCPAAIGRSDTVVQFLLRKGADVNAQGGYYGNAFYYTALEGREGVVQLLLDNGANINALGGLFGNKSAVQAASENNCSTIVQILLARGAKPLEDMVSWIIHCACNLIKYLIKNFVERLWW